MIGNLRLAIKTAQLSPSILDHILVIFDIIKGDESSRELTNYLCKITCTNSLKQTSTTKVCCGITG
jgi:hypothetical protein